MDTARCWWRSRLRLCATSRKAAGLIPDVVIGIFYWHNPSGRTMALESTQPLTEMRTRNISWGGGGKRRRVLWAENLTTYTCGLFWNLGALTSGNPQGLSRRVMGLLYLFIDTVSHRYVSAPKGKSSASMTDTLQREAQQNELPDVTFISMSSA
jgi:hypothetical protein